MTDQHTTGSGGETQTPVRRRGRPRKDASTPTITRSSRRATGNEVVDQLHGLIDQLIKENQKLRRDVERLTASTTRAASGAVERSLVSLQRRVERALSVTPAPRRRGRPPGSGRRPQTPAE